MAQRVVRGLVGQHEGELRFVGQARQDAEIHERHAIGKHHRVDIRGWTRVHADVAAQVGLGGQDGNP